MAAETLTGDRAAAGVAVYRPNGSGALAVAYGSYAIAATVEDGDIFELCKLPAGAVVVGGALYAGDLDTGTEVLDIDLGWAANGEEDADPDGFVNSGVLTGDAITDLLAAGSNYRPFPMTSGVISFTNETTVQAEANVPSNVFAAGTITAVVYYVVP